jgi:ketosteroid isomerase-like protein
VSDPAEVARSYFAAVSTRDAARIRTVFAPDSELVTAAGTFHGPEEIANFYAGSAFAFEDLQPRPGRFVVDGDHVAVEIELRMGGRTSLVADFFTVTGDRIRRLAIYLGPSAEG